MWWNLEKELERASVVRIRRVEERHKAALEEHRRRARRTERPEKFVKAPMPWHWAADPDFNPYSVRARRKRIAHGTEQRLRDKAWQPHPPVGRLIPKKSGSHRLVSTYTIPDEVLSGRLYRSLMRKNLPLMSAHSYAYRPDLVTFDALRHIESRWQGGSRVYIAEFDFRNYFDTVSHEYVYRMIDELNLYRTPLEGALLRSFLESPIPYLSAEMARSIVRRTKGFPQGTSVSLFLANLALIPLDREFESLGIQFSRYADDSLLWSSSYDAISRAVDKIYKWCQDSGVEVNHRKSPGIRILTKNKSAKAEWAQATSVTYLSHKLSLGEVDVSDAILADMRSKVDQLIYLNLIQRAEDGSQNMDRLNNKLDRDYVTLLTQLRRYLYGHYSENEVRRLAAGGFVPRDGLQGKISLFPSITTMESLRKFDQYARCHIWLGLRKRQVLLASRTHGSQPIPWGKALSDFDTDTPLSLRSGRPVDLRVPSAVRMAAVVQAAVQAHGPRVIGRPSRLYQFE